MVDQEMINQYPSGNEFHTVKPRAVQTAEVDLILSFVTQGNLSVRITDFQGANWGKSYD